MLGSPAHTPLHRSRLLHSIWKRAVGQVIANPAASASSFQRDLSLGSYRTAWRMARLIREAMQTVEWPLLTGEIELCDVNIAARGRAPISIWLASERRPTADGLIRCWRDSRNLPADLRLIATALKPGATIISPPSGLFHALKALGFRQRGEALGTAAALPAATAAAAAFRRMLQARRHHGFAETTLESYLGEFVFRHNATALGWTLAEQRRRVLAALRAPRPSA